MIVHRAWIGGLATSLLLGIMPGGAEPIREERAYSSMTARATPPELFAGEPGCPPGEKCDRASRMFAGSLVLDAGLPGSLVLVGEGWGMSYRDAGVDISQGIAAIGVRSYLANVVWLQAGIGGANGVASSEADSLSELASDIVPAAMFGAGFEVDLADTLELDVSMHTGSALSDGQMRVYHASFGIGLRW